MRRCRAYDFVIVDLDTGIKKTLQDMAQGVHKKANAALILRQRLLLSLKVRSCRRALITCYMRSCIVHTGVVH